MTWKVWGSVGGGDLDRRCRVHRRGGHNKLVSLVAEIECAVKVGSINEIPDLIPFGALIQACEHKKAREGKGIPDIAWDAKLTNQTVYNIMQGKSWCELPTIYRVERALNAPLWHHEHITRPY